MGTSGLAGRQAALQIKPTAPPGMKPTAVDLQNLDRRTSTLVAVQPPLTIPSSSGSCLFSRLTTGVIPSMPVAKTVPATATATVIDLPVAASDGSRFRLRLHGPEDADTALYFLPALGVGLRPNDAFAAALAANGIAVAVHEWRGLGESSVRAGRAHDWGYRELLEQDIPAGLAAAAAALPRARWRIGGHSLGAQLALLHAARHRERFDSVLVVASGVPDWRTYTGPKRHLVRAVLHLAPLISAVVGHFPGPQLGFGGREARGVMRDWARSGRNAAYRVRGWQVDFEAALQRFTAPVDAFAMQHDPLVPRAMLDALQAKTPLSQWTIDTLGAEHFRTVRPDHFGWLKEPQPLVERLVERWRS
jgi:predicted alpha/beta hydrolase